MTKLDRIALALGFIGVNALVAAPHSGFTATLFLISMTCQCFCIGLLGIGLCK